MCATSLPRFRTVVVGLLVLLALVIAAPLRAQNEGAVRVDLGGGQSLELIRIAPGTFQQGSRPNVAGRGADETERRVTLTRPFLLGKYPVTRGQFARFVTETHYRTEAESGPSGGFGWDGTQLVQRKEFTWRNPGFAQTDDHPVTLVTYRDAVAFLQWLSRKAGRTCTLPSEAQWEFAARGGSAVEPTTGEGAWHKGNSGNATHPVGQKPANAWGLGDMLGNVWEWCEDWYAPYPLGDATDPLQRDSTLSDKPRRVLRGGSWMREAKFSRPATRYRNDPSSRNADNGFRVMTVDVSAAAAVAVAPAVPVVVASTPARFESGRIPITTPVRSMASERAPTSERFAPSAPPPKSSGFGFGFGWLILLPVLAVFLFVVRAIARAISSNMGGRGTSSNFRYMPGQPLRVRLVDDGFWIVGDGISTGTPISCRYEVNNQAQQTEVRYEGGPQGQFVFTGQRPANVSVSVNPDAGPMRSMGTGIGMSRPLVDDEPRFRGHPPAY